MTDLATPIIVASTDTSQQLKAQVRIVVAAVAGALIGRHLLPAWLGSDTILDAVSALIMLGVVAAWQAARVRLQHSRLWSLATNRRVPDSLIRPASTGEVQ